MAPARPSFAALLFESPAIKSWKDAEAPKLRRALVAGLEAAARGAPLVLDVLVELEAVALEPRVEASTVLLWRSRPSTSLGARVRRTLGFYSGESRLAAAVALPSVEAVDHLLPDTALWDAEFTLYPKPDVDLSKLPDPHFEVPGFASHVAWTVNQDAGNDSWLLTARDEGTLAWVCECFTTSFKAQGFTSRTSAAPPAVFSTTSE